jgi:hypothetical protein
VSDIRGRHPSHFAQPTAAWATRGAVIGAASVMGVSAVLILLSQESMALLGAAALAALFGGAGFGAMLGAVLAALRADASEKAAAAEMRGTSTTWPSRS